MVRWLPNLVKKPFRKPLCKPSLSLNALPFSRRSVCYISPPTATYLASNSEAKYWASDLKQFLERLDIIRRIHGVLKNMPWSSDAEEKLRSLDVVFNVEIFCQVLRSRDIPPPTCIALFHWLKNKQAFLHTFHTYDTLIGILRECGKSCEMLEVIEDYKCSSFCEDPTYFHNLIRWHAKANNLIASLNVWDQMRENNVKPGVGLCNIMIDLLGDRRRYRELLLVYHQTVHTGYTLSPCTYTILIKHLASSGHLVAGAQIFEKLPLLKVRQTSLMFAILIAYSVSTCSKELISHLSVYMQEVCAKPTRQVLAFMRALESSGKSSESNIVAQCFWPELTVDQRCALIGSSHDDEETYDGEQEHNENVYYVNNVERDSDHDSCINVHGLAYALKRWEPHTASSLRDAKVKWTSKLIYKVLCHIRKVDVARNFFCWVQDQPGFRFTAPIISKMISLLSMDRDMLAVEHLLSKAKEEGIPLSVHVLTAVIKAYGMIKDINKVIETFHRLKDFGLQPNMETYENVIHALVKQQYCLKAKEYFDQMKMSGLLPSWKVYVMLIECFGLTRGLDKACSIFREKANLHRESNPDIYTAMIKAYFWNRKPDSALETFKECKKAGLEPTPECMETMNKGLSLLNRSKEAKALRYAMESSKKKALHHSEVLIQIDDILEKSFLGVYLTSNK